MISTSQTNINPFTGQVLSDKYFGILEKTKNASNLGATRRDY